MPVVSVSSTTLRINIPAGLTQFQFFNTTIGQLIGPLVTRVASMAAHPLPGDLVTLDLLIEALPQIHVLDRLLGGRLPAALLPVRHPLLDALHDILRVSHQAHLACK